MSAMIDKRECRRRLKEWRAALSPQKRVALSAAICRRIQELPAYREAEWVLGYAPLGGEVDVRPLLLQALAEGKRVALPCCEPTARQMTFYELRTWDELAAGAHGILEPPKETHRMWPVSEKTLCLVPALGYDKHGHRVGYGAGYYDRFLPNFVGVSVGVCPQECLWESLPHESTDQPVTVVVTEV